VKKKVATPKRKRGRNKAVKKRNIKQGRAVRKELQ
jgi:hypothetical protein